jgi:protein MAK16
MFDQSDHLIWNLIGEKEFCTYKSNTNLGFVCKSNFNLTNMCSRQSCPISNSRYATIIEQDGIFFLLKKDSNKLSFPKKIWKKIPLSRNFLKAVQEINFNLAFWPKFFLHYTKKKLMKLTQFLIRNRLKELSRKKRFDLTINLSSKISYQQTKIENNLKLEKSVEHELLNRLNLGIYGKLYPNFPLQFWKNSNFQKIQTLDKKNSFSDFVEVKRKETL